MTDQAKTTVDIKFTQNFPYDNGRDPAMTFEAGVTYHDLPPRFADRFVKRGVAEYVTEEDAKLAKGTSSDVSLKLQDPDRADESALRGELKSSGESDAAKAEREANEKAKSGGDKGVDYSEMKAPDLKALVAERGLTPAGTAKPDLIKALERDDEIQAALAEGRFDDLTIPELQHVAEQQQIDLTGKTAKPDVVEAVKAGYKAPEPAAG